MVDFHQRRRVQPSRSLPMSALNQRERSDHTRSDVKSPVQVRGRIRTLRTTSNNKSQDNDAPNPYRPSMTRRTPQRALSHSREAIMASVMSHQSLEHDDDRDNSPRGMDRSSSPSKPSTKSQHDSSSSICCNTSSPERCLIPRRQQRRSFGIFHAVLKALVLMIVGFGGGILYNRYNGASNNNVIDIESIPSVLLTDELVKKLAHDNQLQEAEIQQLKQQVKQARVQALQREIQQQTTSGAGNKMETHQDIPEVVSMGDGKEYKNTKHKQPPQKRVINGSLRAVKRLIWDDFGNVQEMDPNAGVSAAVMQNPHEILQQQQAENQQKQEAEQPQQPSKEPQIREQQTQQQEQPPKATQGHIYVPETKHSMNEQEYQEHYHQEEQKRRRQLTPQGFR
ncbi:expressed unknown protein [Seminavis robusta]|uniref:Uncharacterized protein n=1 Tax=Seminavis robusta TaxID=568900 RepID=A0A9N8H983_9STRA|nr:expressed unknown protein [Seminavis robusta]|eukprot:Sro110_g054910.1 n/a (395) ;mRNA; f:61303-62487